MKDVWVYKARNTKNNTMITKTVTVRAPSSQQEIIDTIEELRKKLDERGYELISLHKPDELDRKLHGLKGDIPQKPKKRRKSIIVAFLQSYLACVLALLGILALAYYWR